MNDLARLVHRLVTVPETPDSDGTAALSVEEQAALAKVEALLHSTPSSLIAKLAEERPAFDWAISASLPLEPTSPER